MDSLALDHNALHLIGLTEFARANPDRALIVVLPSAVAGQLVDEPGQLVQTLLSGEDACTEAGSLSVRVRFQRDLRLSKLCFYGSTPDDGVRIQAVFVGDEPVFTDNLGVSPSRFDHPLLAGVVDGWQARAGTDLTVVASAEGPARLVVSVIGLKRTLR